MQQEDCGGVSVGLWYDMINTLSVGLANLSPDMDRSATLNAIRHFSQHQSRISHSMVSNDFV